MTIQELEATFRRFMFGLLAKATDGDYTEEDYASDRRQILANSEIKKILPSDVAGHFTASEFRTFMKAKGGYAERREFIYNALKPVLEYLENIAIENDRFSLNEDSYELGEQIGYGGFGKVYKYQHKLLSMDFAIKVFEPCFVSNEENSEGEKRFFREAKMLFHLNHENIVHVYDIGRTNNRKPFIRLEYVDGRTLSDYINNIGGVSFERTKKPIRGILSGLSYAHKNGIVHRDLKPSNVMVQNNGGIKIIDFGISAYLETSDHSKLTQPGVQICGGSYQDPQLRATPELRDVRSDIYSLGGIWYFLLTNKDPSADTQRVLQHLSSDLISPAEIDIVLRCLNSDVEQRFQSCDEIIRLLFSRDAVTEQNIVVGKSIHQITNVTRRDIFQLNWSRKILGTGGFIDQPVHFALYGDLEQFGFLKRLYKLDAMPSTETRFATFEEEIIQHTCTNDDWDLEWVFEDDRLELFSGDDDKLLRFLCELFHPEVRDWRDPLEMAVSYRALGQLNDLLKHDGYEIFESHKISNRPVFSYRYCL